MPKYSRNSKKKLETCSEPLKLLFTEVIKHFDCTIVEGHRGQRNQDRFFDEGRSRIKYPNGKHNAWPSRAVDVAPYLNGGVSWDSRHCLYFAGLVMGIAKQMDIEIRWGGDWDRDNEPVTDQDFQDLVHFEFVG